MAQDAKVFRRSEVEVRQLGALDGFSQAEINMQVNCSKCSQPIALADIIKAAGDGLSHIDCKRPHVLTPEERALVFLYCSEHVVARCAVCDISYHYNQLATDILDGRRTNIALGAVRISPRSFAPICFAARCCHQRYS